MFDVQKHVGPRFAQHFSHVPQNFLNLDDFHSTSAANLFRGVVESGGPGLWRQRRGGLPVARAHGGAQRGLGDGNDARAAPLAEPGPRGVDFSSRFCGLAFQVEFGVVPCVPSSEFELKWCFSLATA